MSEKTHLYPKTIMEWAGITSWQNKDVLLIAPGDSDIVSRYANNGAGVKCIEDNWGSFSEIHHLHGKKNPVVYMLPVGYLRGVNCQRFDYVINCGNNASAEMLQLMTRATKFNGKVIDVKPKFVCEKEPGFLVSSYPRVGTHMAVTALARHPELMAYGEVFNMESQNGTHKFPDPRQVMEGFWTGGKIGVAAHAYIGQRGGHHRLMAPQRDYNDFWDHLPRKLKVISIRRHNLLARHVSHLKAKQTNIWNKYGDDNAPVARAVNVDMVHLDRDIGFIKKVWESVDKRYPDCLVVWYEDMCEHWEREYSRMLAYLEVEDVAQPPSSNKIGRPLREDIANYDQVVKLLEERGGMEAVTAK